MFHSQKGHCDLFIHCHIYSCPATRVVVKLAENVAYSIPFIAKFSVSSFCGFKTLEKLYWTSKPIRMVMSSDM